MKNTFANFEKIMIQRIDKRLELVEYHNGIDARLPLHNEVTRTGQIVRQVLYQRFVFTKINGEYVIAVSFRIAWQRHYWKKWRFYDTALVAQTDKNLLRLISYLKESDAGIYLEQKKELN